MEIICTSVHIYLYIFLSSVDPSRRYLLGFIFRCFFPGSAAGGGSPLIRAPAPRPWHCRRLSVVTEGYIRLPPLPPTHLVSIRVHPRSTIIPVIYSVFCVWCSKNIVFYRVLWPSPSPGFILATLKNHGFFMVLGLRQGSGTDNWPS